MGDFASDELYSPIAPLLLSDLSPVMYQYFDSSGFWSTLLGFESTRLSK
jgi:hypothetical protein